MKQLLIFATILLAGLPGFADTTTHCKAPVLTPLLGVIRYAVTVNMDDAGKITYKTQSLTDKGQEKIGLGVDDISQQQLQSRADLIDFLRKNKVDPKEVKRIIHYELYNGADEVDALMTVETDKRTFNMMQLGPIGFICK